MKKLNVIKLLVIAPFAASLYFEPLSMASIQIQKPSSEHILIDGSPILPDAVLKSINGSKLKKILQASIKKGAVSGELGVGVSGGGQPTAMQFVSDATTIYENIKDNSDSLWLTDLVKLNRAIDDTNVISLPGQLTYAGVPVAAKFVEGIIIVSEASYPKLSSEEKNQLCLHEYLRAAGEIKEQETYSVSKKLLLLLKGQKLYKFNELSHQCTNDDGIEGWNQGLVGPCSGIGPNVPMGELFNQLLDPSNPEFLRIPRITINGKLFLDFRGSNFAGTLWNDVDQIDLSNIDLDYSKFRTADFSMGKIVFGRVAFSDFIYANFSRTDLGGKASDFHRSNFNHAQLAKAKIYLTGDGTDANFSFCNFGEANLDGLMIVADPQGEITKLGSVTFAGSSLTRAQANFSVVHFMDPDHSIPVVNGMNKVRLTGAYYDQYTKLPFDDSEALARGMVKVEN